MKHIKPFLLLTLVMAMPLIMTSCYVSQFKVGSGPKLGVSASEKEHYLVFGLVKLNEVDSKSMAEGRRHYEITHQSTFGDGLLSVLTLGIYTPRTVNVKR
ncbi:hypothetical protein FUAX_34720 [Fulvitalea axinellae]|uniref:Bor protein n=1 Tax=Fulvitalea axinellae TaxID=1182444 RepID=A0AAU9DEV5_9BACT|nr:hypothetical protein FUAX_34720 [Fulvitalea axinellae]